MKEPLSIETEWIDDIPLLIAHIQQMKLVGLLDKHFPVHGNRKGLSLGEVSMVLPSHLLSQADYRMNRVQECRNYHKSILITHQVYGKRAKLPVERTSS